jgi:glycerol-3-phosphate dehydrogenase
MLYDVLVIGGGVVGALTARELSRYRLSVAVLEKADDVAMGATKANSAIVHGGFDPVPGTLKAILNVRGTAMMEGICRDLHVSYRKNGSLVLAFSEKEKARACVKALEKDKIRAELCTLI